MEKEKKKRILRNVGIVVLSIVIIGLFALCIYLLFVKNNKQNEWYYIHKGNVYKTNFESGKDAVFDYPIININTKSVINLNNYIKNIFDDLEKSYKKIEINDECTCVEIDGKFHCAEHIGSLNYEVLDYKDNIVVLIYHYSNTNCASGGRDLEGYVISKKSGEGLDNKQIIEYFKYNSDKLLQEYNEYMQKEYKEYDETFENENNISELSLIIYDNKLIILTYPPVADGTMALYYDGNNVTHYEDAYNNLYKW